MAKKKRKISAYNRHVGREMRKGKTMKQAAASWKKGGKTTRSKKRSYTRKKKASNPGKRKMGSTIGGYSPLGIIKAAALYVGTSLVLGRVAPSVRQVPGGTEMAAGGIAMVSGLTGNAFLALGAAKAVAWLIGSRFNGGGGNGGYGYDY